MANPSVSVVIPAYNAAQTIGATLDAVMSQTFRDFEVIVVDDGSTDETAFVAQGHADRLPGFRLIRQPNGMVAKARNTAIEVARGSFIAPIDADDLWHPTYLEKMVAALEAAGPATVMAYAPIRITDAAGVALSTHLQPQVEGWAFYRMLVQSFATASSVVFRRGAAAAIGNYDVNVPRASDYLIQVLLCGLGPITTVPEHLVAYRQIPGSQFKHKRLVAEELVAAFKTIARSRPDGDRAVIRRALAGYLGWYARALLPTDGAAGIRCAVMALALSPATVVTRAMRRSPLPTIRHGSRVHFFELDPKEPSLLQQGDPRLRAEFLEAERRDAA